MRIEKREVIYLSNTEMDTWSKFSRLVENICKETSNPNMKEITNEMIDLMGALYCEIELEIT